MHSLVASALLATAAVHVVVNSHVAYSNCITPFFTTLGVWTLFEAVRTMPSTSGAAVASAHLSSGLEKWLKD